MTDSDVAWLVGQLFSAYATGYYMGFLQYTYKRASEII